MSLFDFEYAYVEGDLIIYGWKKGKKCPLRLVIPEGVTAIGELAFQNCWLEELVLPKSLKTIGAGAFSDCADLTEVELATGCELYEIGEGAFFGCTALERFSPPQKLYSVGARAFGECHSLKAMQIPRGVRVMGKNAINGEGVHAVPVKTVPKAASVEPKRASAPVKAPSAENERYTPLSKLITRPYENGLMLVRPASDDLTELILPPEIVAIERRAFYLNGNIRRFKAGKTLLHIFNEAFRECSALCDVEYDCHTAVSECAFYGCPFSVAMITPLVYEGAFRNSGVKRVEFKNLEWGGATQIPAFLLSHTPIERVDLPDCVTAVGRYAFAFCKELKRVSVPDTVSSMGNSVFEGCSSLEEFTMPKGVGGVPAGEFAFCGSLKRVKITDRPGRIGEKAFYRCDALRELRIPKGIYGIGSEAVLSDSLERVIFEGRTLDEVTGIFGFEWLLMGSPKVDIVCTDRTYIKKKY